MNRVEKANSEPRKAYLRRIVQNNSLDDIYSDERETLWNALELPHVLRQTVKSQNSSNGEYDSWDCLDGSSRRK